MKRTWVLKATVLASVSLLLMPGFASADSTPTPAPPSVATPQNGEASQAKACRANLQYFYNSNMQGASAVFCGPVANLAGYTFTRGSGLPGYGQQVKNNAASIRHTTYTAGGTDVRVYFNSNYQGLNNGCAPGCAGNLTRELKNQNASHKWD